MTLSRRQFLATSAAFSLAGAKAVQAKSHAVLKAGPVKMQMAPSNYPATEFWSFNGTAPGPEIRLAQGARLTRLFENGLAESSSIHWHGLRLPNAMDGVPGVTQNPVAAGGSFLYDFTVPDAGTFWYHSHQNSVEQLARGLYGPIVVEEPEPLDIDRDEVVILDDWRLTQQASIDSNFANPHDFSHAGRLGNFVTSNHQANLTLKVRQHERLRLRLINASNSRIFNLALSGLEGWIVALDGMPVAQPEAVENFSIAPAQRVDLIVDVTASNPDPAYLVRVDQGQGYAQVTFDLSPTAAGAHRAAPQPLPPNSVPEVTDLNAARIAPLLMAGGAMGGMQSALLDGQNTGMRDLAQKGMFWAFNGEIGLPKDPLVTASRGEAIRIPITNQTVFPHAMHLHGHHFREVLADGSTGPLRDTLLLHPNEVREIAFVADNPGDWLLHCHMLAHQAAGMKTWIKVT